MIGWWIVVSTQTPEERDGADQDTRRAHILAQWEAGAEGIRWVERLAAEGKADKLKAGGYPNRYTARAADVLPLLAMPPAPPSGPLIIGDDYALPANWRGQLDLHPERIAACPLDRVLTIDAWDQD